MVLVFFFSTHVSGQLPPPPPPQEGLFGPRTDLLVGSAPKHWKHVSCVWEDFRLCWFSHGAGYATVNAAAARCGHLHLPPHLGLLPGSA